ncbi:MAG: hypothetical protein LBT16_11215 [Treponema sp.]|jgi:hypothetical protein|nr:hypothetical protein [Treponema sp.]
MEPSVPKSKKEGRILKRLKIIIEGKYLIPQNVQREIEGYSRIPSIPPYPDGAGV